MAFPCVDKVYTGGESEVSDMAYIDPYLYTVSFGGYPTYHPKVHKINPITYEKIAEWTAPSGAALCHSMCTDCEYLYVGTSSYPSPYRPIHVFKVDPKTMTTVTSWTSPTYRNQQWAEAMAFDFNSNRLLVLEDGSGATYRLWKLTQDLTVEMYKQAESGWPPSQYHGHDITILGDYCYIATGGTPGEIVKRRLSDLEMVDYFQGTTDDPDYYIEGIFFNVCNDGEFIYTATYDYIEERPMRVIQINPEDMTQWNKYYGQSDELMAYGCYAYGGRIYAMLYGWNGIYWGDPGYAIGEVIVQINPDGMGATDRYMNWTMEYNSAYKAVGDGSRLHVGFWGQAIRSVLQFEEEGDPECIPWVGSKVILLNSKDRYTVEKIRSAGVGNTGMLMNAPSQKCFLPEVSIKAGDACKITSFKDKYFARKI